MIKNKNLSENQIILLGLIYSGGSLNGINEPIDGSIKLMKEAFLLREELKDKKFYDFVPYDFGPCSFEIYKDINLFVKEGIVKEEKRKLFSIYSINNSRMDFVSALFDKLNPEVQGTIRTIKKTYNNLSYYRLISFVYERFPSYRKLSKFRF